MLFCNYLLSFYGKECFFFVLDVKKFILLLKYLLCFKGDVYSLADVNITFLFKSKVICLF